MNSEVENHIRNNILWNNLPKNVKQVIAWFFRITYFVFFIEN